MILDKQIVLYDIAGKDCVINYKYVGSGPKIILLHGWMNSSNLWNSLISKLQNNFTLIVPDIPGFGHSSALSCKSNLIENTAYILDEFMGCFLDDGQIYGVICHSLGGLIMLNILKNNKKLHPAKLILCDTPVNGILTFRVPNVINPIIMGLFSLPTRLPKSISKWGIKLIALLSVKKISFVAETTLEDALLSDPSSTAILFKEIANYKLPFSEIDLQSSDVLLLRGKYDNVAKKSSVDTLRSVIISKCITHYEFSTCAHNPMLECPSEFEKKIEDFL